MQSQTAVLYPIVLNPSSTHQSYSKNLKIEYLLKSSKGQSKTTKEYIISSPITLATDIKICFHFLTLELACCQIIDAFWLKARPSVDVTKKGNTKKKLFCTSRDILHLRELS